MPVRETHIVPELESPTRLSDYAGGVFECLPTRKGMKKAIDKGLVRVNGVVAGTAKVLSGGEKIELMGQGGDAGRILDLKLEVIHEDMYLAVINKPAGIEVSGNKYRTVERALPANLTSSTLADSLVQPRAVHRLDYPTTGILLVAKTHGALTFLSEQFEKGMVDKTYLAITTATMLQNGTIDHPIDGKRSVTDFVVRDTVKSDKYGTLNLVACKPQTGRRHQIRKHLSGIGNPILGDKTYGFNKAETASKGLYLHAWRIAFTHPQNDEYMVLSGSIPSKFNRIFPIADMSLTDLDDL